MDYMFHFGTTDAAALLPQVIHALKRQAEVFPDRKPPKGRKSVLPYILSAVPTAAGAALLALGVAKPKKRNVSLAVGAAGIAAGAGTLALGLGMSKDQLEKVAQQLLDKQMDRPQDHSIQAIFSPAAMILMEKTAARTILYHDIHHVIEEEDLFLLSHGEQLTILLKQDLTGDLDAFCDFIGEKSILI